MENTVKTEELIITEMEVSMEKMNKLNKILTESSKKTEQNFVQLEAMLKRKQYKEILLERAAERQALKTKMKAEIYAELRAEVRAEIIEEKAASGDTRGATWISLTSDQLNGRRLQVYNTIKANKGLDRHQIHTQLQETYAVDIATSTVSGRITELLSSGLIKVDGIKTGEFGKHVRTYAIVDGE